MRLRTGLPLAFRAVSVAAVLASCSTAAYEHEARGNLRAHIWNLDARGERGQSEDQVKADWVGCEDEVVQAWVAKGAAGSSFIPFKSWHTMVAQYKDFEGCMKQRGYKLVERGK